MCHFKPQRAAMRRNKPQCAAASCNKSIFVDQCCAAGVERPKLSKERRKIRQIEALNVRYCARAFLRVTVCVIIRVFIRVTYPRHLSASIIRVTYPRQFRQRHLPVPLYPRQTSAPFIRALIYPRHLSLICIIFPRQSSATASFPRQSSACLRVSDFIDDQSG